MNLIEHTRAKQIKQWSIDLGFDQCGISKAAYLEEESARLEDWLKQGRHGAMTYMENYFDLRLDPRKLMPGTQSVVTLTYNYFPKNEIQTDGYKISKYAYGEDYHVVIKDKLKILMRQVNHAWGDVQMRSFVDSAPILEKAWAVKSGVGWIGKNGNILSKKRGSFFFLAEILMDVKLETDHEVKDHCGSCTKCIDACPTQAIYAPMQVDGSKCISYFTIELKEQIPSDWKGKWEDWAFGCDICQDVCPWNRFSKPTHEIRFAPKEHWQQNSKEQWLSIEEEVFKKMVKGTPLERSKWKGFLNNLRHLEGDL